jgi:hypothetical protein
MIELFIKQACHHDFVLLRNVVTKRITFLAPPLSKRYIKGLPEEECAPFCLGFEGATVPDAGLTLAEVQARTEYHRPKTFIVQNKHNSLFNVLFTSIRFNLFTENQSSFSVLVKYYTQYTLQSTAFHFICSKHENKYQQRKHCIQCTYPLIKHNQSLVSLQMFKLVLYVCCSQI